MIWAHADILVQRSEILADMHAPKDGWLAEGRRPQIGPGDDVKEGFCRLAIRGAAPVHRNEGR